MKRYFDKSVYVLNTAISDSGEGYQKIRAFDLDSTLIETQSGNRFSRNAEDYQWCRGVLEKLHQLHADGYRIIVFSNQSGISSKNQKKIRMLSTKLSLLVSELGGVPIIFFLAAKQDWCRKPCPGMWTLFVKKYNNGVVPTDVIYVGDAAGRPNDFSCSDRKFARNIGIKFATPEEYFRNLEAEDFEWGGWDPNSLLKFPPTDTSPKLKLTKKPELLICVGFQGSGKSSWYSRQKLNTKGIVRVNQDTLRTPGKCKKATREALAAGKTVYLDNTNLSLKTRKEYIEIAKKAKVPVRCIWFSTSLDTCKHMNWYRAYLNKTNAIPEVAYRQAQKHYTAPTVEEGFKEIIQIPFVLDLKSNRERRVFKYRF